LAIIVQPITRDDSYHKEIGRFDFALEPRDRTALVQRSYYANLLSKEDAFMYTRSLQRDEGYEMKGKNKTVSRMKAGGFASGLVAGLATMASPYTQSSPIRYPHETAASALTSDWQRIGGDFQRVIVRNQRKRGE
jgi:hypothetical protein